MSDHELGPIEIEVGEDGDPVRAHRTLKREIGREGFIQKMKESLRYTPNNEQRRQSRRRQDDDRS